MVDLFGEKMPGIRKCLVGGCNCNEKTKTADEQLYYFPKSPTLRSAWLRLLGLNDSDVNTKSCVCSKHFEGGEKSAVNKLPVVDIGKTEEDKRKIVADYCHQVIMKSRRPFENIMNDAAVFLENNDEYDSLNIGNFFIFYFKKFFKFPFFRFLNKNGEGRRRFYDAGERDYDRSRR